MGGWGRVLVGAIAIACVSAAAPAVGVVEPPGPPDDPGLSVLPVDVDIDATTVTVSNGLVERTWSRTPFRTTSMTDLRTGRVWTQDTPDFRLVLDGAEVRSDSLAALAPPAVEPLDDGGTRVTFDLGLADRVVEVWPDTAGFATRTILKVPGTLSGYTLDEAGVGPDVAATIHSFRAGADWREPGWEPDLSIGDSNSGDWRHTTSGDSGEPVAGTAQWLSARAADGRLFLVMERNDYASSTMRYDGATASAVVDLSRDLAYVGPFEEQVHAQNPGPGPARHRVVRPPLALERAFTGMAVDADDEPWQHHVYLSRHRMPPWEPPVVFNTNGVDTNRISTGAKDDMDFAEFERQLAVAEDLGVEVFVFDDGWQARSGDWCADSAACPEPRNDRYPPRFPDPDFTAVRTALGDMRLGLWMTPMHFHPSSNAFARNPQWACAPTGLGTAAVNAADPDSGSNEAGIGTWNPLAWGTHPDTGEPARLIDYIEDRIRRAIDEFGATYFKFDFLVWLDCAGVDTVDTYEYREAFVAMLDRLVADHPQVVFQIDETNDYRLFPFESVAHGPSWFQNGKPTSDELLHNVWSLAPFVPGYTLGQHAISNSADRASRGVDYLMAVALPSHITFWNDLTTLTDDEVAAARAWVDRYAVLRDRLATMTYPLLDDPRGGATWTGLQPWNLDDHSGLVLVYRQNHPDSTRSVPLRGLDPSATYRVTDAVTGATVGTFPASTLRGAGLPVTLDEPFSAGVYEVVPVG